MQNFVTDKEPSYLNIENIQTCIQLNLFTWYFLMMQGMLGSMEKSAHHPWKVL